MGFLKYSGILPRTYNPQHGYKKFNTKLPISLLKAALSSQPLNAASQQKNLFM